MQISPLFQKATILFLLIFSFRIWGLCSSPTAGAGHMEYISGVMKVCNGSSWVNTVASATGASCSAAGKINHYSGSFCFCNGTNWYSMKGTALTSCAGTEAGTFNWNGTTKRFCDGTTWFDLLSGGSCSPGSQTFSYTGSNQTFNVPAGCTSVTVKLWGAGGGGGTHEGGGGGFTTSTLTVTPGESLTVIIGQGGQNGGANCGPVAGTYGGGGAGTTTGGYTSYSDNTSGGGRSAIRRSTTELLTAGGGGGGGYNAGGPGGGTTGVSGTGYSTAAPTGGTQASGGTGGPDNGYGGAGSNGSQYQGGAGAVTTSCTGGGGGGYYGGGGAQPWGGGAGGSSYVTGTGGSTTSGSGLTSGGSSDPDYSAGIGAGGLGGAGGNGLAVISWGGGAPVCEAPNCGGTLVGGYCWYLSSVGASCAATCSGHGGYNSATNTYAGTAGSDANCTAVMAALGAEAFLGSAAYGLGIGCANQPGVGSIRDTGSTTDVGTHPALRRACACTN